MTVPVKKSDLSPGRRRLLGRMQRLFYGSIENLHVRDGEPVFEPAPTVIREVKCAGENAPRPEADLPDFKLKLQVLDLFHELDRLGTGVIPRIEVKAGLPFRVLVPEPA